MSSFGSSPTDAADTDFAATEDVVVVAVSSSTAVGGGGGGGAGSDCCEAAVSVAATNFCHCFVAGLVSTTATLTA